MRGGCWGIWGSSADTRRIVHVAAIKAFVLRASGAFDAEHRASKAFRSWVK